MSKSRLIRVAPEFDDYLDKEILRLKQELEQIFGIKVTKPKATKYLTKKMEDNGGKNNGLF